MYGSVKPNKCEPDFPEAVPGDPLLQTPLLAAPVTIATLSRRHHYAFLAIVGNVRRPSCRF
jgi:hypothetical protein